MSRTQILQRPLIQRECEMESNTPNEGNILANTERECMQVSLVLNEEVIVVKKGRSFFRDLMIDAQQASIDVSATN